MEPLHSLLDENRRIWLWNGESVQLTDNIRIIFLMGPADASTLEPKTLARIGKVSFLEEPAQGAAFQIEMLTGDKRKHEELSVQSSKTAKISADSGPSAQQSAEGAAVSMAECSDAVCNQSISVGDLSWLDSENDAAVPELKRRESSILQKCSAESWILDAADGEASMMELNSIEMMDIRVQELTAPPQMTSAPCAAATHSLDVYLSIEATSSKPQLNGTRESVLDPYVGQQVTMLSGKNKGKRAFVEKKINQKYKLHIEGVEKPFEYYPKQFQLVADTQSVYLCK